MKTMYLKNFWTWSGIALLTCCNTGRKEVTENHVQWDSLYVDKSCPTVNMSTNPGCSLQIRFIYPVDLYDKAILESVQQLFVLDFFGSKYVDMTPQNAVEKYAEDYINSIMKEAKALEEDMPAFEYYEMLNNRIIYNRNLLLSVTVNRETFTGGAHGAHNYVNRVIDLKTGRLLSEKDLFIDDYREDLAKIIVDNIAVSNNVDSTSDLENFGFFNVNEISPNGNFYVDDTGITYTFNEYEIAAYALGPVVVQLPYEQVRHLLRADSPLSAIAF
jgi:hypothetical protein